MIYKLQIYENISDLQNKSGRGFGSGFFRCCLFLIIYVRKIQYSLNFSSLKIKRYFKLAVLFSQQYVSLLLF